MNVLITGASGYTGERLCYALAESHHVVAVVRDCEKNSFKHPKITALEVDLSIKTDFENFLPDNINVVIHLAQSREYRNFPEGAEDMFSINSTSTFHLLEWGRKIGLKHFVFTSTGNVYRQSDSALSEASACEPSSFYAVSKYNGEQMCKMYSPFFQVTILRVFGIYGAGQKGMLVPNIYNMIQSQKEISLADGVGLKLTPINVVDAVMSIQSILTSDQLNNPEILNLSGDETIGLNDLIALLEKYSGLSAKKLNTDSNYNSLVGDNSKLRKLISHPFISFEQGVKDFVEPYLKALSFKV